MKAFGIVIAPFDDIFNRVDISCIKVGILTTIRRRINEEITILADGRCIKIGIIEFDEEWFPFKFDPQEKFSESDEEGDDEVDVDAVSDTWIEGKNEDGMEEGEIDPRDAKVNNNSVDHSAAIVDS